MTGHLHLAASRASDDERWHAPAQIRVVLADDHALMRRSLRLLLDAEDQFDVVAEATDISTMTRDVYRHAPHVLVLDLQMPGGSSIEAIHRLRRQIPKTEIVVLTMEQSPAFAQCALAAGAVGFVLKDRSDTELPEAIRRAARGEEYVSPRVAAGRIARSPSESHPPYFTATDPRQPPDICRRVARDDSRETQVQTRRIDSCHAEFSMCSPAPAAPSPWWCLWLPEGC